MEIKIVINGSLLRRVRQSTHRHRILWVPLLIGIPALLLAKTTLNSYGLTEFSAGEVISSSAVNANFATIAGQTDALQQSVDALTGAVTVDGSNNVGIGNDSPSANLDVKGNFSKTLSGIVSTVKGSTEVTGADTKFTTELTVGDAIKIGTEAFTVVKVTDADSLTLSSAPSTSLGGAVAYTDASLLSIQNGVGVGKLIVDRSGNLGIGTTSPSAMLNVKGGQTSDSKPLGLLRLQNYFSGTGTGNRNSVGIEFANGDSSPSTDATVAGIYADTADTAPSLRFYTRTSDSLTEQMRITSAGHVGIGTANPDRKLEVNGAIEATSPGTSAGADGGFRLKGPVDNSYSVIQFVNNAGNTQWSYLAATPGGSIGIMTRTPQYTLDVNGQIRASNVSVTSDARLKKDIEPLTSALRGIECLQGVSYRLKDPAAEDSIQIGLIAQEVETCYPEVVMTDAEGYKSVAYDRLVAPLIEAVKEQQQSLEAQAIRLRTLQADLAEARKAQATSNQRLNALEARLGGNQRLR